MDYIKSFITSNSRNHIAFVLYGALDDVHFVDVGFELSTRIEDILQHRKLSMKAQDYINDIFSENSTHCEKYGNYLALKNIGILSRKT